jgi:Ser/Thr protein kinase RdoA (MazF antagonist)
MPTALPVTHSLLSPAALVEHVLSGYDVGRVLHCRLYMHNLNDTYFVWTDGGRYVLRVSRTGWRTDEQICAELDAVERIAPRVSQGVAVAHPVRARTGEPLQSVQAPEGRRQVVLFAHAAGKENVQDDAGARLYGRAAAQMHGATDGWASAEGGARPAIDLEELLERPLSVVEQLLGDHPSKRRFLLAQADRLRQRLGSLPPARLDAGWCFGDFHGGNAAFAGDAVTFFDFDLCGHGWRAYDVAVFRWGHTGGWITEKKAESRWRAFLEGYAEHRPLGAADLAAVPLFVMLRQYWFLGLVVAQAPHRGFWWPLREDFFPRSVTMLKAWEKRLDAATP